MKTELHSEECAERAYRYAELYNHARAQARSGRSEIRAFWRGQAKTYEQMVGVWMALAKVKREAQWNQCTNAVASAKKHGAWHADSDGRKASKP